MPLTIIATFRPNWIPPEEWDALTQKQRDYIVLRRVMMASDADIMRALYFTSRSGLWKFRVEIDEKIARWTQNCTLSVQNDYLAA